MFLLNPISTVDLVFLIIALVCIVIGIGLYFLIPVLNKKVYRERRDALRRREAAFKKAQEESNK